MTVSIMVVCKEDKSSCFRRQKVTKKAAARALKIDEAKGFRHGSEFGKWFVARYCGAPSFLEFNHGVREHSYKLLAKADLVAIEVALSSMRTMKFLDKDKAMEWFRHHLGKSISTETWPADS